MPVEDFYVVLASVERNARVFPHISAKYQDNKDIVLAALRGDGWDLLSYASDRLKDDEEVVREAMRYSKIAYKFASERIRSLRHVAEAAVRDDGYNLEHVPWPLSHHKYMVMHAVQQTGTCLRLACKVLKNDKDVVLAAVKRDGGALTYASDELKNDKDVVIAAVKQDGMALCHASNEMQDDKDVVLEAIGCYCTDALLFASARLKNDADVVNLALKHHGPSIRYASLAMRNNKQMVLKAVKESALAYQHASFECREDPEVAAIALSNCPLMVYHAPPSVWENRELMRGVIKSRPAMIQCAPNDLYGKDFVLSLGNTIGKVYKYLTPQLKGDRDIILAAVRDPTFQTVLIATLGTDVRWIRRVIRIRWDPAWVPKYWDHRLASCYPTQDRTAALLWCNRCINDIPPLPLEMIQFILGMLPWRFTQ